MKVNYEIENDKIVETPSGKQYYLLEVDGSVEKRTSEVVAYLALKSDRVVDPNTLDDAPDYIKQIMSITPEPIRKSAYLCSRVSLFIDQFLPKSINPEVLMKVQTYPVYNNPLGYVEVMNLMVNSHILAAEFYTRIANEVKNNLLEYTLEKGAKNDNNFS